MNENTNSAALLAAEAKADMLAKMDDMTNEAYNAGHEAWGAADDGGHLIKTAAGHLREAFHAAVNTERAMDRDLTDVYTYPEGRKIRADRTRREGIEKISRSESLAEANLIASQATLHHEVYPLFDNPVEGQNARMDAAMVIRDNQTFRKALERNDGVARLAAGQWGIDFLELQNPGRGQEFHDAFVKEAIAKRAAGGEKKARAYMAAEKLRGALGGLRVYKGWISTKELVTRDPR